MILHILNIAYTVLLIAIFFGVTVFIHELGHFLVARRMGMKVETFSIGFGPAIWKRTVNGIDYQISAIPLGGYVRLPDLDISIESGKLPDGKPVARARIAPWKKIPVLLAGVTGNLLLAYLLAWVVYVVGKPAMPEEVNTVIGYVETNSAAFAAGLRGGDVILAVNHAQVHDWTEIRFNASLATQAVLTVKSDKETRDVTIPTEQSGLDFLLMPGIEPMSHSAILLVDKGSAADKAGMKAGDLVIDADSQRLISWLQFTDIVASHDNRPLPLVIRRDGKDVALIVTPHYDDTLKKARIGVMWNSQYTDRSMIVHPKPSAQIAYNAGMVFRFLKVLTTRGTAGKAAQGVGGPIAIFAMFAREIQAGIMIAISFAVFFNVNLAVINLFPFPVLDGGHIILVLVEWLRGKPANQKVVGAIWNAGAFVIISLFLFLSFRDVRLVSRLFGHSADNVSTNAVAAPAYTPPAAPVAPVKH